MEHDRPFGFAQYAFNDSSYTPRNLTHSFTDECSSSYHCGVGEIASQHDHVGTCGIAYAVQQKPSQTWRKPMFGFTDSSDPTYRCSANMLVRPFGPSPPLSNPEEHSDPPSIPIPTATHSSRSVHTDERTVTRTAPRPCRVPKRVGRNNPFSRATAFPKPARRLGLGPPHALVL